MEYLDLASRKLTPLAPNVPWDVDEIELSEDGSVLAFVANEDGIARLHLLDTRTRRELPAPELPAGQIGLGEFHKKLPELAFSLVSSRSTADVYSYNWRTRQLARWTTSEAGGLDPETFPLTQLVRFPSFDKRMIPAFVTKPGPRFKAPYPVLISIHGGPEGQARPGLNASYSLNELGIALIQPNVRGSVGYGKTYVKLDNAALREDSVKDIGALLDWIRTQPDLDASRVLRHGRLLRRLHVAGRIVHYSDRLKCGIDVVGISNWVTFLKTDASPTARDLRRVEYGDERDPKMRDFLESISPLNRTDGDQGPDAGGAGQERPEGSGHRIAAIGEEGARCGARGVVHRSRRRGPRLPQEAESGLPELGRDAVFAGVSIEVGQRRFAKPAAENV